MKAVGFPILYYQAVATEDTRRAVFHGNVSEVIRLPAWAVSYLLAGHWILVVLGALGFGLLLWKRPLAVVFLPLAGIAGAAYFLGARFTVFSAAFFGLGLGCGFVLLLRHFQVRTRWRWAAMVLLLPVVFWFVHKPVTHFRPDTVMSLRQVEVLRELGPVASTNAVIWNTWDLGFATNYYTRRRAIEMIGSNRGIYTNALAQDDKSVAKAQILRRGQDLDHYVVVSWEKLGGMENLLATGTFDQRTGTSAKQGQIQRLTGTFEFDLNQGFLIAPGGRIPLCILDVIEEDGPQRFVWPWHGQGNHAVLNRIERTGYLMDATVADTMYVRMLLGPAEEMGPEFEVVVDDFPWVRVYRVE